MGQIDLHLHTTASDGSFTPRELVTAAKERDLTAIAVTDHDTVAGVETALAAGREQGVEVVPAIEFTTYYQEQRVDILGYYIDHHADELLAVTDKLQHARRTRAQQILDKLAALGVELKFAELEEIAGEQGIGRPHIARLMVAEGYVEDMQDAFDEYLEDGGPAYVPKYKLEPAEAVELIQQAGGLSVLAHPGEIADQKLVTELLAAEDFAGIEAYYSGHSEAETEKYQQWAADYDLLVTGGSDCHGPANEDKFLIGTVDVPEHLLVKLKQAAKS